MTVYYRVYTTTADAVGFDTNAAYATARNSTAATDNNNTADDVGQELTASPSYGVSQVFFEFDTSAIPSGGTPGISVYFTTVDAGINGDTIQAREVSSLANKIAGASISGNTLLGGIVMDGAWDNSFRVIPLTTQPARTASLKVMLGSIKTVNNTAPTTLEMATVRMADTVGGSLDAFIQFEFEPLWKYVGVGTSVQVTGTAHTLTEPSGVQVGDLLVACISSRIASTTSITLPSAEWTLVSEQMTNNILTTSSAVASGMMAYCIRGASAPSYAFTHPTAPSVALGRVVAYRNVYTAAPLDTQTSFTTAIATTAVSGAGLTTAADDELIVAMLAGGQEAGVSVFAAATSPTVDSGTVADAANDPLADAWVERAGVTTTTGADTSLSIFDAVKTAAGATGNLTCTASVSASHVVVAGAFRLAPPMPYHLVNVSQAVMRAASW